MHGTTILCVRKDGSVALGGDGQVTMGDTVVKAKRQQGPLAQGRPGAGRVRGRRWPTRSRSSRGSRRSSSAIRGNLPRAAVELAKDWRSDRILRRLEALLVVADLRARLSAQRRRRADRARRRHRSRLGSAATTRSPRPARLARRAARRAARSSSGVSRSPPTSASSPIATSRSWSWEVRDERDARQDGADHARRLRDADRPASLARGAAAAADRGGAGPVHRRPGRRQEGGRHRHPEPLAPESGAGGHPRRDPPEQHHHDRPHGRGEDRDRPAAGAPGGRAVPQGGGVQVHRGGLRRARRRVDDPRPGGRLDHHWCAPSARTRSIPRPRSGRRSGSWTCCCRRRSSHRRRRRGRSAAAAVPTGDVRGRPGGEARVLGPTTNAASARARSCASCSGTASSRTARSRSR